MREPIVDSGGETVTFMTSSLGGGMRLWFGLLCLAPIVACLDEPAEIDGWRIAIAGVFGLLAVVMAGPFARSIGTSVTWHRAEKRLEFDQEKIENIGAVALTRKPMSESAFEGPTPGEDSGTATGVRSDPAGKVGDIPAQHSAAGLQLAELPGPVRLQLLGTSPELVAATERIDRALQGRRAPHVSRSALEAGIDPDALPVVGTLDDNVTEPFGIALAASLARLVGVPLIVSDCGNLGPDDASDDTQDGSDDANPEADRTQLPDATTDAAAILADPTEPWQLIRTASELATPLVERFGRTQPFPPRDDGDDGDDGRAVDATVRCIMPVVGGATLLLWHGLLSLVADGSWLVWSGLGLAALGVLAWLLLPTRVALLADGTLHVRRIRHKVVPVRRIVDLLTRPGDQNELLVLTDRGPLNAVIPGEAEPLEELRVCLRGGIAAIARGALRSNEPRYDRPASLDWLPSPCTDLDPHPADVGRVANTGSHLRIDGRTLDLDHPVRTFLSWAPDRTGQPIVHLECRQRASTGAWTRVGLRARTHALDVGAERLRELPELGHPFPFVQSETLGSLLGVLRRAHQMVGDERWI